MNYRTVISFGPKNIEYLMTKYNDLLLIPCKHGAKMAHSAGVGFGYSYFIRFAFIGIVFYIAAIIIEKHNLSAVDNYLAVFVLFMSALGAGMNASNIPSISKARTAANQIFEVIDEKSKIDVREEKGIMKIEKGAIEFNKVNFIYPSRTKRVLKEFNMSIPATKKIALVGYSGCGKSTISNLLLRFYDTNEGSLLIDGRDIRDYNVAELRRQIGIVMQEPILFNVSIKDNILYGNENASD
jgi:ATP-binding cassette subfamily B (MDR/TAP) protein 1